MPIFAALFIAALLGGGTSIAAQGSLPGDALYPVKVHVNEAVREALAVSTKGHAGVEADLATLRLAEAQKLAARGTLSTTTAALLAADFSKHADKEKIDLAALIKSDPILAAQIKSDLDARIAAHQDILATFEKNGHGVMLGALASLAARLDATTTAQINAGLLANVTTEQLTAFQTRVKGVLDESTKSVTKMNDEVSATTTASTSPQVTFAARANAALKVASTSYTNGSTALAAGDKVKAYASFIDSLKASAKARIYADIAARMDAHQDKKSEDRHDWKDDHATSSKAHFEGDNRDEHEDNDADVNAHGGLRIRTDADDNEGDVRAEGGIHLNIGI